LPAERRFAKLRDARAGKVGTVRVDGRELVVSGSLLQPLHRRTNDILRLTFAFLFLVVIVTSSLVSRGHDLKRVIGSTNFTEFAVTLTISLTFMLTLGWSELNSAIGLIIGGVIAAPFGAILVKRLPVRPLMVAVSMIIIGTSAMRIL
jgi:uncharacterized membrane protein YfcA